MQNRLVLEQAMFMGAGYGYEQGQSVEKSVEQLNQYYQLVRFDDATLEGLARVVDPTYNITAQDREEQMARRALSERARNNFYKFLHINNEVKHGVRIPRGLDMLLDRSGDPAAKEHNERVLRAFAVDSNNMDRYVVKDAEERTQLVKEFLDKMDGMDFSYVFSLSDEQLADEFPKMVSFFSLCQEGGDGMLSMIWDPAKEHDEGENKHFELDEEYREKLIRYRDQFQGVTSMLKLRFNQMMDPNYELMHVERIVAPDVEHRPSNAIYDKSHSIGRQIDKDYLLEGYALQISNVMDHQALVWDDQVRHIARTKKIDPENLELVDVDGKIIQPADLHSRSIIRMQNSKTGESFLMQMKDMRLVEVAPSKALRAAKMDGGSVLKALEDADPWRLRVFAGSKEFDAMKKQMKAVEEAVDKLDKPVSEDQFKETMEMVTDLATKTKAYLDKKGIMTLETKDSERVRVVAANFVQQYAERTALLLDADRRADDARQKRFDANNNAMGENLDAENEFGKERSITRNAWKPSVEEETEAVQNKRALKLVRYYLRGTGDDPVEVLGRQIFAGLGAASGGDLKLPDNPAEVAARMVAYDFVMRERAARATTEPGPIEKEFRNDPTQFVRELAQNQALQSIVQDMTVQDFRKFVDAAIGNKGVQQLTDRMLKAQGFTIPEAQQPVQNLQPENQPKAPEGRGMVRSLPE